MTEYWPNGVRKFTEADWVEAIAVEQAWLRSRYAQGYRDKWAMAWKPDEDTQAAQQPVPA